MSPGSESGALKAIKTVDGASEYAEAQGVKEPDTVDVLVEADMDIRRSLFHALARAQYPILMMRPMDMSLGRHIPAGDRRRKGGTIRCWQYTDARLQVLF